MSQPRGDPVAEQGMRMREFGTLRHIGSDRVVATTRIIVAALSLFAIWLDPLQPATGSTVAYALLAAYLLAALSFAVIVARRAVPLPRRTRLIMHATDILVLAVVIDFTNGTTQPVFGFFVYLMVVGHLRWGWKGTLGTALAVLLVYALVLATLSRGPVIGGSNLDDIVIRLGYLGVTAAILLYLGHAQDATRQRMLLAAAWPSVLAPADALPAFLGHAARLLEVDHVVLLRPADRAATAELVYWDAGRMRRKPVRRAAIEPHYDGAAVLAMGPFHWSAASGATVRLGSDSLEPADSAPLPPRLLRACRAEGFLGIPFLAGSGPGCLLAPRRAVAPDDTLLAEIVQTHFRAWADETELAHRTEQARELARRMALAREIHDTILQSLAGVSLQLQLIEPLLQESHPQLAAELDQLVQMLSEESADWRNRLHRLTADDGSGGPETNPDAPPLPPAALPRQA